MIASSTRSVLIASLVATSTTMMPTEAFQASKMPSVGSSGSGSELAYVVFDGDQDLTTVPESTLQAAGASPSSSSSTITTNKNKKKDYAVANHDHERSFWLQALQNLESSSDSDSSSSPQSPPQQSSSNEHTLWTRIACAFAPSSIRETYLLDPTQTLAEEAHLVRVGDADLDIAVSVPEKVWEEAQNDVKTTVVEAPPPPQQQRRRRRRFRDQKTVTIRINFPEGPAFDKDAYTFEDELSAVIRQVRLLERNANDRLSGLPMAH
eukprot:jgi/Psemu1/50012/gm1.50012_g